MHNITSKITKFVPLPSIRFLLIILSFALVLDKEAAAQSKISRYLKKADSSAALKGASWGFCLLSGTTGRELAAFDSEKYLVPASVQKVITTSAALSLLGDTFRYKTQLWMEGDVQKNILKGHLIIKGYGNPVLGSEKGSGQNTESVIDEFIKQIKAQGFRKIEGDLIADLSYFEYEPVPSSWTWFDIGNYYAPCINALNINENQYELWFQPGSRAGDSTKFLRTVPVIDYMKIINHTTTAEGGGDQTYIPGPPRSMEKHVYGKMPIGKAFKIKGAIPQPELYFLGLLKERLAKEKIEVTGSLKLSYSSVITKAGRLLYTHYSETLASICKYANYTSNNLAAESLLRTIGAEKGREGSTQEGLEQVRAFFKRQTGRSDGLKIVDGSGLSKYNLISPKQLANYLNSIRKEPWSACFISSLPVSGTSGTLERFCEGPLTTGKVYAKSGTMERVKCYAGYVKDKKGNLNPFAIMVNNHDVPNRKIVEIIEGLMELCVE